MKFFKKLRTKSERGQAIILIAFAMVGLIAIVGLMTDGGILLIEYARLKRGIDAAAVASAQQFRKGFTGLDLTSAAEEFLILNQSDADNIEVYTCNPDGVIDTLHDPDLCGVPIRKLIRINATRTIGFGFLRVIGINGTTLSASSVGEAASLDLVLVFDTSASMAYETSGDPQRSDSPGDDPALCNDAQSCEPLESIKAIAQDFVDEMMFFPYDRVAIVTMTSQEPNGFRDSVTPQVLSDDPDVVRAAIDNIKVNQPAECDTPYGTCRDTCTQDEIDTAPPGSICDGKTAGYYLGEKCPAIFAQGGDRSSCGSSNVGGALIRAGGEFTREPMRDDSFWVIIALVGGPANASNPPDGVTFTDANADNYPDDPLYFGFCPPEYWNVTVGPPPIPPCRDASATSRHPVGDALYDADDYARDMADFIADPVDGQGITVFTIGLGELVQNTTIGDPDAGEQLLTYVAETAGDSPGVIANHGFYSYSPDAAGLEVIFGKIAENIFTRISQ